MKDLLQDVRIVLILPDRDGDTTMMGHKLYPPFFNYIEDTSNTLGFSDKQSA